jgi:hypothetical protein
MSPRHCCFDVGNVAVVRVRCFMRMQKDGFTNLVDYRLAQHPCCPSCGARQTQSALYGMRMSNDYAPWYDLRGCCVTPDDWTCGQCGHRW